MKLSRVSIIALCFTLAFTSCRPEKGCTDLTAINFNPEAEENDGSCEYAQDMTSGFSESFSLRLNEVTNPGVSATNLVPANPLTNDVSTSSDAWFDNAPYKGAFDSDWTQGWTLFSGYNPSSVPTNIIPVSGSIVESGATMDWTNDNVYLLEGFCFVEGTLNIQEGTIIKGAEGTGDNSSAMIVAKNGTLNANGTASAPIIMTFENDPLDGSSSTSLAGQWGGLIMLGNAGLNSSLGETQIEGIPTDEPRGLYGGDDDEDSSGTITYLSIRHGGTDIGAGNEINGFTLGGVGSGTVIDYVEVIANADDGVEFFGGTARTKHLLTAYCGDDSFDYDEGFRGLGQFWCAVQAEGNGDRGGEHDGGTEPEAGMPFATPKIFNATYVGNGDGRALTFRDSAGGEYHNSVFVNWSKGVDIENIDSELDSYDQFLEGRLSIESCVFWDIAAGTQDFKVFTVSE